MNLTGVLASDAGLAVLGSVVGGIWTLVQSSRWYRRMRTRRFHGAVQALEAGVELTYRTYVRAIKQSREDGKLTDEERRRARRRARQAAIEFGQTRGIDVIRELGPEYVELWLEKTVARLRRR